MRRLLKVLLRMAFVNVLAAVDLALLWWLVEKQGFQFQWAFAYVVFASIAGVYVGIVSGDEIK